MRTSLSIPDEDMKLVTECAKVQNRTVAGQLRHLIVTHPEVLGFKAFKTSPDFQKIMREIK